MLNFSYLVGTKCALQEQVSKADVTSKCSRSEELKYTGDIAHITHSCIMYICPCSSIQNVKCLDIF